VSVNLHRMKNGLRIVTENMPGLKSASIGIWVNVGGRHERLEQNGVAHFLEHMAFKGTTTRTALEIAETIEDVGGFINAYTSREMTAYYARVLEDHVDLALELIADILLNSTFDADEMEIERGVILQEIGQASDTPDDIIFDWLQFFELAPKLRLRSPSQEFIIKTEPIRTRWYADYMKEGRGGWYADLTRQSRIQYGDVMGPSKLRTTVKTEITPADMSQQLRLKPAVKEVGLKHIEWEETVKGKRVKVRINKESLWTDEMARTTLVPKEKTPVRGYTPKVEFRPQFRDVERLRTYKVPLEPAKGTPIRPFSLPLDRAFQNIQPGFQIDQSLGINLRDAFRFGTKEGTFQIDVLDTSPVTSQDLDNSLETDLDLDTTQTTAQTTGGITTTTSPPPPRFPTPPPPKIDIPDIPDIIRKRPKPTPGTLIELEPIDVNIDLGLWGVKHRMLENVYGDIFGGGIKLDVDFKADLKLDLDLDLKL